MCKITTGCFLCWCYAKAKWMLQSHVPLPWPRSVQRFKYAFSQDVLRCMLFCLWWRLPLSAAWSQLHGGADFLAVPVALGCSRGGSLCWSSGLLLRVSVSGNDIEARLDEDYPVVNCVCREIRSVCIKCFWLSAKVSAEILGEGSTLPFLFYWRSEWMSLLASVVIPLSIKLIFPFSGSCLSRITAWLDCRGIVLS